MMWSLPWSTSATNHAHDDDSSYMRSSWPLVTMLLLGIILGQNSSSSSSSSSHEDADGGVFAQSLSRTIMSFLEHYLVPFYTLVVLLYLTAVAFRPQLVDLYCWRRLLASPHHADSIRKAKQQLESQLLTTAATMPLEEDEREIMQATEEQEQQPIDMSGAFKLVSNDNFEGFLAEQGVPWALRRAANQARPVHRITHIGCHLTVKIEGIIESQTSYVINGPPVETNVRGRIFRDAVSYLTMKDVQNGASSGAEPTTNDEQDENANQNSGNENRTSDIDHDAVVGIKVLKDAIAENYTVTVQRQLSSNQQEITMTSTVFFRDGRDPVRCIQQFKRVE